jgi:hypothetical protein
MSLSLFGQLYVTHVCTKLTECIWAGLSSCIQYNENKKWPNKGGKFYFKELKYFSVGTKAQISFSWP